MNAWNELRRKAIHIVWGLIPVSYMVIEQRTIILSLCVLTFCCLITELFRLRFQSVNQLFVRIFGSMLRKNEHHHFTSLAYYLMGSLLSVFFFEKILAIVSICFLIFGDSFAAVVGVAWGRKKLFQKSLEGSFACFVSCSLIGGILLASSFDWPVNITLAITGALTATVAEHFSNGIINDNLTVPLISGFAMTTVVALQ